MKKIIFAGLLISLKVFAQAPRPTLKDTSAEVNKSLPQIYDHATKLTATTIENNNIIYHFIVGATQKEFDNALPKVKAQVQSTICSKRVEKSILMDHKANIVYRYESDRGNSLGEFMLKPEQCSKTRQ